jgi:hypothetical protein
VSVRSGRKQPRAVIVAIAIASPGCHCERADTLDTDVDGTNGQDSDLATSTWGASGVLTVGSSEESTGALFDASRWIGRYHYENPIGEWGDPKTTEMLVNFEIFEDSTAVMFYDRCSFDVPELIHYEWAPDDEPGWIELYPGAGESSLRLLSGESLDTLRVHLIEPCRELGFEYDGVVESWFPFYPGASCWINRCPAGLLPRIGYCEGEEPPPCP